MYIKSILASTRVQGADPVLISCVNPFTADLLLFLFVIVIVMLIIYNGGCI